MLRAGGTARRVRARARGHRRVRGRRPGGRGRVRWAGACGHRRARRGRAQGRRARGCVRRARASRHGATTGGDDRAYGAGCVGAACPGVNGPSSVHLGATGTRWRPGAASGRSARVLVADDVDRPADHLRRDGRCRTARRERNRRPRLGSQRETCQSCSEQRCHGSGDSGVRLAHLQGLRWWGTAYFAALAPSPGQRSAKVWESRGDSSSPMAISLLAAANLVVMTTSRRRGTRSHDGIVIVGGGLAGQRCAESLRRGGYERPIRVVCSEPHRPYDRPPLSKELLTDATCDDRLPYRPACWYEEESVDLLLGVSATALDVAARRLALSDGTALHFRQLLIATGGRPQNGAAARGLQQCVGSAHGR